MPFTWESKDNTNCPLCKKEMTMFVSLRIKAPAKYAHNLSKTNFRKKGIKITAVDWGNGYLSCRECYYREKI